MGALLELGALLGAGAAAVLALFVIVRMGARALFGTGRRLESSLGVDVLDQRLRRGEITQAEYDQARRALGA